MTLRAQLRGDHQRCNCGHKKHEHTKAGRKHLTVCQRCIPGKRVVHRFRKAIT